jgi:hypothetical protein
MSTSTANITPTNIALSPMRVMFNGVDLGGTLNDVAITINYDMADIKVDQFGKSIVDQVVCGLTYSVKFTLAEAKNMDNWKVAFPSMHEIINGGNKSMYSDMQIGDHLYPKAQQLLLHPLENANSDLSQDFLFYKASTKNMSETKYGPDKQSGLTVEFIVYPDVTVSPARYMTHGDPSNGMTPASAASPVPGSNTGNGTITNVSVFNGVTKTETITALVLDSSVSGNNVLVTGSISGALGYCFVAAASASFVNFIPTTGSPDVINFKVTQGSTQFAANDSFTIATTASNFS